MKLTTEMIRDGIHSGLITFSNHPEGYNGTVCHMGENWFLFDGMEASSAKHFSQMSIDTLAEQILAYLEHESDIAATLYSQCYIYLLENLSKDDTDKKMTIAIKMHNNTLPVPEMKEYGDWVDLRAAETVEMKQGEYRVISLGVSMKLPDGYEAHVAPRSSTFKNYGILMTNSFGIIDNSYSGDNDVWGFPALAMRDTVIHEGERICQFRIVKRQPKLKFEQTEHLSGTDRGGFGSTGTK